MYAQMQHEFQVILMGGAINTIQRIYSMGYKFVDLLKFDFVEKFFSRIASII